jgi:hypothetical protein
LLMGPCKKKLKFKPASLRKFKSFSWRWDVCGKEHTSRMPKVPSSPTHCTRCYWRVPALDQKEMLA